MVAPGVMLVDTRATPVPHATLSHPDNTWETPCTDPGYTRKPGVERGCPGGTPRLYRNDTSSDTTDTPKQHPEDPGQTRVAPRSLRSYKVTPSYTRVTLPGYALVTPWAHQSHTRVTPGLHAGQTQATPEHVHFTPASDPSYTQVTPGLHLGCARLHLQCTEVTPREHRGRTEVTPGSHPGYTRVTPWFCLGSALHAPHSGSTQGNGRLPPGHGRTLVVARAWTWCLPGVTSVR